MDSYHGTYLILLRLPRHHTTICCATSTTRRPRVSPRWIFNVVSDTNNLTGSLVEATIATATNMASDHQQVPEQCCSTNEQPPFDPQEEAEEGGEEGEEEYEV